MVSETNSRFQALRVGIAWGLGHSLTISLVGFPLLLFRLEMPLTVREYLEGLVGIVLVLLGASTLKRWAGKKVHRHPHRHGDWEHEHLHIHPAGGSGSDSSHDHSVERDHSHATWLTGWRPLLVGMIHGLAGSGAVAVLILASCKHLMSAVLFLLLFSVGSLAGMAAIAYMIVLPVSLMASRARLLEKGFAILTGVASIGLGAYLIGSTMHGI